MENHLIINKDERDKWDLLKRIDEKTYKLIKFFVPHHDRLYAALIDKRLIAVGNNLNGMLGVGHKNEVNTFEEITQLRGKSIKDIACGWLHVLVLTDDKQVWAWGWNNWGEVGVDNKEPQHLPQLILDKNIESIKCGYVHSLALTTDGNILVWGVNIYGQLGVQNAADQMKPVPVLLLQHEKIVFITTGAYHSVAVTVDGKVYGWGCNLNHQLGLENVDLQMSPVQLEMQQKLIKSVACSGQNSLFLTIDGLLLVTGLKDKRPRMLPLDKEKLPIQHIFCIDYYYIDENIDKLFIARTSSGHVLQWHDFDKNAECESLVNNCSLPAFIVDKFKFQYFRDKIYLLKPKEKVLKPKTINVPNLHAISHPALTQLFQTKQNYDVEFVFDHNKVIRVHRNILSISSPELYSKLPPPKKDLPDEVTRVTIKDYPYSIYYLYLSYLYTVPLPPLSLYQVSQLLRLARNKHEVFLQQECICRLSAHLDNATCCQIYEIAENFGLKHLKARAFQVIKENFTKIKLSNAFKQMKKELRDHCLDTLK